MVVLIPTLNLFSKSVATRSGASQAPEAPKFTPNNARMQELPGGCMPPLRLPEIGLRVLGLRGSKSLVLQASSCLLIRFTLKRFGCLESWPGGPYWRLKMEAWVRGWGRVRGSPPARPLHRSLRTCDPLCDFSDWKIDSKSDLL